MRYDAESGRILITCREFVSTARRGIATQLPSDESEPNIAVASRRMLSNILGEKKSENLNFDFGFGEYNFNLEARAEKISGCKLWFATEVDTNPNRPSKECSSQLRGEGYITAYIYAKQAGLDRVDLSFVYINSEINSHAEAHESTTLQKLEKFFNKCISTVSVYAKPEIERVTKRLPSMKNIKFPYGSVRRGQGEFVRSAYKSIARGGTLFAVAPTGTGKTISAIFPAVRAMGDGKRDKTFYLTPKETTANAAIECILNLAENGAVLRGVKLTAKEKACRNGLLCRENRDDCDYARCNRLQDAALAIYNEGKTVVTTEDIYAFSDRFKVCPYELALTYSELCDIIICDFNYLFDPDVYIRRFFTDGGNFIFLIDEAHNLPDRAREMYSAEISDESIREAFDSELLGEFSKVKTFSIECAEKFTSLLFPIVKDNIYTDTDGKKSAAVHLKDIPTDLYEIFDTLSLAVEEEIFRSYSAKDEDRDRRIKFLQNYHRKIKKFRSVMQRFDSCYEMFIFYSGSEIRVKLFCIDTGLEISKRLLKGRCAVFFSATLTPLYYYKAMLGGDGSSEVLEVDSPFDTEQLSVSIMHKISTRFSEREDTLSAVCRIVAATVSAKRGNYMIFSPSYAYSELLAKSFSAKYPKIKILSQKKNMTRQQKEAFLAEFSKDDKSYLIGFCVMGGIYSEGIDLAGDSLIGAVVVGIGMPGLSYEREAICAYYDDKYEEGKQFAYIYPGMNRVLQAAGRVIRREDDRGVIVLIDDRFDDPIYKKIIPSLWSGMKFVDDANSLRENLDEFWKQKEQFKKLSDS